MSGRRTQSWDGQDEEDGGYNVMQVCLNGHQITAHAASMPQLLKDFCSDCGAKTITACPECQALIQGYYHSPGVFSLSQTPVPNNCHACGTAYPWRQDALASAIEILQMELKGQDAVDVTALVSVVAIDSPKAEVAALKLKNLMSKLGKPAYEVAIKVISDLASETAKKTLGMK